MTRKMMDSGVEWIGMIPDGWTLGRIGELYSERNQKVSDVDYPPLSVTMQGVLPQLANVAKTDAHDDRKLVRCGDFAINSRSDRRGSCGIADRDGSVSLINTVLCPRNEMNPRYYNWLFHTTMFADEFYKWGHGIVDDLWTTRWADMKQMSVPCPSLSEQKRIAEYLDAKCASIDDVIAKTTESIEEYKKLKQAVITEAVTKGVRGKRPMKDSDIDWIGQIPKEWDVDKFGRMAHVKANLVPPEEYLDFIQIAPDNIEKGSAKLLDNLQTVREVGVISDNHLFYKGQILYSKIRPLLNKVVIAPFDGLCCADMYPLETDCVSKFVVYSILSHGFESQVGLVTGNRVKMPKINKNELAAIKVTFPPLDEQCEIADYLDKKCAAIDTLISKKQQFIDELTAYKKSLIYEYVTGKKEVPA